MTRVARYTGPCAAPSISLFHWAPVPEHLSSRNNNKTPAYIIHHHHSTISTPSQSSYPRMAWHPNPSQPTPSSLTLSRFSLLIPFISLFNQAWVPECLWPQNYNKTSLSFTIIIITTITSHCITLLTHCLVSICFLTQLSTLSQLTQADTNGHRLTHFLCSRTCLL